VNFKDKVNDLGRPQSKQLLTGVRSWLSADFAHIRKLFDALYCWEPVVARNGEKKKRLASYAVAPSFDKRCEREKPHPINASLLATLLKIRKRWKVGPKGQER
jgi:hypothetical protein